MNQRVTVDTKTPAKSGSLDRFEASIQAFSPDGKILASSGLEGSVKLWDIAIGEPQP